MSDWIDINIAAPSESMKVRWRCTDGVEDCGFFNYEKQVFYTFDPKSLEGVTHWKPFDESPLSSNDEDELLTEISDKFRCVAHNYKDGKFDYRTIWKWFQDLKNDYNITKKP